MNDLARHPRNADPLLLPPREMPYVLHDVLEKRVYGFRDELILNLDDCFLRFGVDIDTDTITSQFQPSRFRRKSLRSIRSAKPWKKYVGKECGWTWLAWNKQGYLDSVLISFDGIEPNVLLHTIGSSIEVFKVLPAEKRNVNMATLAQNIRVIGENAVRAQLESAGFTVDAQTIHNRRIVIADRPDGTQLGVSIFSRKRGNGDLQSPIYVKGGDSVLRTVERVCKQEHFQPYLAFYDDNSGDLYMTDLNHYWSNYRGSGKTTPWKMSPDDKQRYARDAKVLHVNVKGSTAYPTNWF